MHFTLARLPNFIHVSYWGFLQTAAQLDFLLFTTGADTLVTDCSIVRH